MKFYTNNPIENITFPMLPKSKKKKKEEQIKVKLKQSKENQKSLQGLKEQINKVSNENSLAGNVTLCAYNFFF